jgi:hypothetical protein
MQADMCKAIFFRVKCPSDGLRIRAGTGTLDLASSVSFFIIEEDEKAVRQALLPAGTVDTGRKESDDGR